MKNRLFILPLIGISLTLSLIVHLLWFYYISLQCKAVIQLGGEVGCMINEGHWVFVGIPNAVKVGNLKLLFLKFIVRCNGSFLYFFYYYYYFFWGGGGGGLY